MTALLLLSASTQRDPITAHVTIQALFKMEARAQVNTRSCRQYTRNSLQTTEHSYKFRLSVENKILPGFTSHIKIKRQGFQIWPRNSFLFASEEGPSYKNLVNVDVFCSGLASYLLMSRNNGDIQDLAYFAVRVVITPYRLNRIVVKDKLNKSF